MTLGEHIFSDRLAQRRGVFDRRFVWLAFAQWAAALTIAEIYSPYTWRGRLATVHVHVWLAIAFGALLSLPVLLLAVKRPGAALTRHSIAIAQMAWSAVFVHLTGGRIETHFHVFCSLAYLAFYLDIGVLVTAALVVTSEHLIRGMVWPASVYGIDNPEWWRFLEHGFWIAFEVFVLAYGVRQSKRDLKHDASKEADLETLNASIEKTVTDRTRDLEKSRELYRSLVETTRTIPFSLDARENRITYIGPQAEGALGIAASDWLATDFLAERTHPGDRATLAQIALLPPGETCEHALRLRHRDGFWVTVRTTCTRSATGDRFRGFLVDISAQRRLEDELQRAQKLESIGRLASGVAHEINTPVQFVSDSLHFLRDSVPDVLKLLDDYEAVAASVSAGAPDHEALARAAKRAEQIDLPFLRMNMPSSIDLALEGIGRVTVIVRAMREFAHPDTSNKTQADLNHNIESTLVIARNEYKYVADLETSLGELPAVVCNPGEINQVILNLVMNAAHAIAEKVRGTTERGCIRVDTHREGEDAVISISDTGVGIAVEHRDHIFEPFFMTKASGRGTGLSLATARTVVCDKHKGSLTFDTEPGVGTTFHVRIPIAGSASAQSAA